MSLFKLLKRVLAMAGLPSEDYPPSNIAVMIRVCTDSGREDLAKKIKTQWVNVLNKYPATRVNFGAANNIGTSSIKKNVFGGMEFTEWFKEQVGTPVSKEEAKEVKEIPKLDVPAIAIPKSNETPDDWIAAASRTKDLLQNAQRAFKTTEEFISYLNKEIEGLKHKTAEYGPGGAKEKTKSGALTEMAKRVPKWESQLVVYEAKLKEVNDTIVESKTKFESAAETYDNTRITTVAFEKKVQGTLEDVLEFILNVEDLQKQRTMLEKFQVTLSRMEKEKVAASVVVANIFSDIFGSIKQLWNNLVKWSSKVSTSVSKFEDVLKIGAPKVATSKVVKIKLNNATATLKIEASGETITATDTVTNKQITLSASDSDWGLRWFEFNKQDQKISKEKFFKTEQARTKFAEGLENKDNYAGIDAYSDPKIEPKTSEAAAENLGATFSHVYKFNDDQFEQFKKLKKDIEWHKDGIGNDVLFAGYVGNKHVITYDPMEHKLYTDMQLSPKMPK